MWLIPTIIASILILLVGYWVTIRVGESYEESGQERDSAIPKVIEEHPFMLNPILLVYAIFFAFTGIIIFYFWATGY